MRKRSPWIPSVPITQPNPIRAAAPLMSSLRMPDPGNVNKSAHLSHLNIATMPHLCNKFIIYLLNILFFRHICDINAPPSLYRVRCSFQDTPKNLGPTGLNLDSTRCGSRFRRAALRHPSTSTQPVPSVLSSVPPLPARLCATRGVRWEQDFGGYTARDVRWEQDFGGYPVRFLLEIRSKILYL